jgi:hypothetical protein
MIKRLEVKVGSVHCMEPTPETNGAVSIKAVLLDVDMFELMQSLKKEAGVELILDHISDTDIENYLKGTK